MLMFSLRFFEMHNAAKHLTTTSNLTYFFGLNYYVDFLYLETEHIYTSHQINMKFKFGFLPPAKGAGIMCVLVAKVHCWHHSPGGGGGHFVGEVGREGGARKCMSKCIAPL